MGYPFIIFSKNRPAVQATNRSGVKIANIKHCHVTTAEWRFGRFSSTK